jgi:lipopolysaccharide/colanic/teichoic acid biosynthesis glycosyltransferase
VPELLPYPLEKRILDRAGGAVLALVASPLFAAAATAIALDHARHPSARGRWFVRERRISRGREFELLKFRVLREDVMAEVAAQGGNARVWEGDAANLTRSGVMLKRWYLDELPQLWNIVRGDLSLVGPRPWPRRMVDEQIARGHDYRLRVMAGWTGPAQASKGAADADFQASDLTYVDATHRLSGAQLVRLDLGVLRETLGTMLRGEGLTN